MQVLGIRGERIGWRRGVPCEQLRSQSYGGFAADVYLCGVLGPVATAFGPIKAQGRRSLHPLILLWLCRMSLQDLVEHLLRDRFTFKERISEWMHEVVQAVLSTQQTAVSEYQSFLEDAGATRLPPLPFGQNERRRFRADVA